MEPSPKPPRKPRPWLAALLTFVSPGLGQLHAGRTGAALAIGAGWLLVPVAFALGLRNGLAPLVAAAGLYAAAFVGVLGHAVRSAGSAPPRSGGGRHRALGALLFVAATWAASAGLNAFLQRRVARTFIVSSASMAPAVEIGDFVVVVPGEPVERGAVVVYEPPPGSPRSEPLLKRVAGVGGDMVAVASGALVVNGVAVERRQDGAAAVESRAEGGDWRTDLAVRFTEVNGRHRYHVLCTPEVPCGDAPPTAVPPGEVFLLGDWRDRSADSRVHGTVPATAVLGRVRHVYWSYGRKGVRWDRVGKVVD